MNFIESPMIELRYKRLRLKYEKFGVYCPVLGKIRLKIVNGRIFENGSRCHVENTILELFCLMYFLLILLSLGDKIENLRLTGFYPKIVN